jgi:hypothetical protein
MCSEQLQSVLIFTDPIKKKNYLGYEIKKNEIGSEYETYKGKV